MYSRQRLGVGDRETSDIMHSFTIRGQTISVAIYVYEWRLVEEWDGCGDYSCAYFDDSSWLYVVSLLLEFMPNFGVLPYMDAGACILLGTHHTSTRDSARTKI